MRSGVTVVSWQREGHPLCCGFSSIPDNDDKITYQTEILGLQEDSGAKMKFAIETITVFWSTMAATYRNLCDLAFRHLLPFTSTYRNLCDLAFRHLLPFTSTYRNLCDLAFRHLLPFTSTYPNLCDLAFRHLLPFTSTYLCKAAFSDLLHIKT